MSYYKTCMYCGAHLDPGETCECEKERTADKPTVQTKINHYTSTNHKEIQDAEYLKHRMHAFNYLRSHEQEYLYENERNRR